MEMSLLSISMHMSILRTRTKSKRHTREKKDTKDVSLPQLMASSKNLVRFETNRKSSNSSKIPKVFQQCSSQTPLKQKHEIQGQPEYSPKSAKM